MISESISGWRNTCRRRLAVAMTGACLLYISPWLLRDPSAAALEAAAQRGAADTPASQGQVGAAYVAAAGPYLDFMRDHLLKPSDPASGLSALSETEKPINDDIWFWIDDNAKALEAFILPAAYERYKPVADSLATFIKKMSEGPIMFRRTAAPNLVLEKDDPGNFALHTSLLQISGNLRAGEIYISYRFHDGRGVNAAKLSGNWLRFDLKGKSHQFDIEDNITDARLEKVGDKIVLRHISMLAVSGALFGTSPVARVTYEYTIDPQATRIGVRAKIEALEGHMLDNVRATISTDQLSALHDSVKYSRFCYAAKADITCVERPGDGRQQLAHQQADWSSVIQLGNLGFSYALHSVYHDSKRLSEIVAEGQKDGKYHHVYGVYALDHVTPASAAEVSETKLLTSGGLYQTIGIYGDVLKSPSPIVGLDYSASYDYGAELNALGCHYMFAKRGLYGASLNVDDSLVRSIPQWFDRHLNLFSENMLIEEAGDQDKYPFLFGRGLAFTILAVDCMYRATGEEKYLKSLEHLVEVALRIQHRDNVRANNGLFQCERGSSFLDCQAAMVLALSRAAFHLKDDRLLDAVTAGINAIRFDEWQLFANESVVGKKDAAVSVLTVANGQSRDGMRWGFKAGLVLRALAFAEHVAKRGVLPLDAMTLRHAQRLSKIAREYVEDSTVPRGKSFEILTSYFSTETNSESQPWMILGLFPIDADIVNVEPPSK